MDVNYLLKKYFMTEELKKDNEYFCEKCNKNEEAEKNIYLNKMSSYLIVTLTRFKFDLKLNKKSKILDQIFIDPKLNFEDFLFKKKIGDKNEEYIYSLYAIIIHRVKKK